MTTLHSEGHVAGCGWPQGTLSRDPSDLEHIVLMEDGQRFVVKCAAEPGTKVTLTLHYEDGIDEPAVEPLSAQEIDEWIAKAAGTSRLTFTILDVQQLMKAAGVEVTAKPVLTAHLGTLVTAGIYEAAGRGRWRAV